MQVADYIINKPDHLQKKILDNIIKLGLDFLSGKIRKNKVLIFKTHQELKDLVSENFPFEGTDIKQLLTQVEDTIVKYSIAQADKNSLAFPDIGNSFIGIAGDILSIFLNQNLITMNRGAPIATFVEIQTIQWLRQLVGYKYNSLKDINNVKLVGGMWTNGGSMSNYIAILIALNVKFPEIKTKGLNALSCKPVIVLVKQIDHYSFITAMQCLGLGSDNIIWCEPKDDYTSDAEAIENELLKLDSNSKPFVLIGVSGNSKTSNLDNLEQLYHVAHKYKLWFHVDACHGGSLLFSNTLKEKVKGIELSDSVSIDPHKGLFLPYPSSYVLIKNPKHLTLFERHQEKFSQTHLYDLGLISPLYGSRGFHSLKLWLLIKHLGTQGLGKLVDLRHETNRILIKALHELHIFVFLTNSNFYRAGFVYCPAKIQEIIKQMDSSKYDKIIPIINYYTELYCSDLYQSGKLVFDLFRLTDFKNCLGIGRHNVYSAMGLTVGHPFIEPKKIDYIIKTTIKTSRKYEASYLKSMKNLNDPNKKYNFTEHNSSPTNW
ncbi:MAG: pyridoxal-dependent decarboxylase [Alphaproteobacteria bacterium]|nr:pyridoxal-dependent decarboxylase [Alphaproteobacteria bacterium]